MSTMHLLISGGVGGIETLCKDYTRYSKNRNTVVCLWQGGCIADEMKALGVDVVELGYGKKELIKTLKSLVGICKDRKINTVIAHHAATLSHIYMMTLKRLIPGIKTIAYAHGNAEDMYAKRRKKGAALRKRILKRSVNSADHVIAISNSVAKSLEREFDLPPERISVIYNGIKVGAFATAYEKQTKECFKLVYVGRLIWEKGVQNTLDALALLPKDMHWKLTIVGEGNYRKELEAQAEALGIQEKVDFLGNRRDVPKQLNDADCFVHIPNWEEGFGITIIEAMAAGKICICANRGAIEEIIEDKKDGILTAPDAMASEVAEILENVYRNIDSAEYAEMRQAAQKRAADFSMERYAAAVDKAVAECVQK